jgi:molybdopterin/thiamine biosynthesis adenylyltransferase
VVISLVPTLHDLVGSAASRNVAQLREFGVEPNDRGVRLGVNIERVPSPSRWVLASTLIDMLLRLDPLVREVQVAAPEAELHQLVADLGTRLPLETRDTETAADFVVGIGPESTGSDLVVDAVGWLSAIGLKLDVRDDGNPIGPLVGAALAAAETFKWAFRTAYPAQAAKPELVPWSGVFSSFSYGLDEANPAMSDIRIAMHLVGVGGVGAGFVRALAGLGQRVTGSLELVDDDHLTTDNLNRVSFATLDRAIRGIAKASEAETFLKAHCPRLSIGAHKATFDTYKRRVPRRDDRLYDVVVIGLDNDEARLEVQRDLPRILIDGSTGKDMNARVERVEFGQYGCLGCTRQPIATPDATVNCDAPADPHAPSLSFLSSFPGFLAAGEVIKDALGLPGLQGQFSHYFRYGPNPDLLGTPAFRSTCVVGCQTKAKLAQFKRKYSSELPRDRV